MLHLARADVEDLLTVDRHRKAVEPLVTRLPPLEGRPRQGELLTTLARPAEQLRGSTQWDGEVQAYAVLLEHRVAVDRHLGWLDGRLGHGRGGASSWYSPWAASCSLRCRSGLQSPRAECCGRHHGAAPGGRGRSGAAPWCCPGRERKVWPYSPP